MDGLPLHYQFQIKAVQSQIDQMSPDQLRKIARLMAERIYTQEAWIQAVNRDYAKTNRPLPFVPLDPQNFNEGAE